MTLWRLYYHIVWTTKDRYPYITTDLEKELYLYIINKTQSMNSIIHALGGIEDHIHLVISIPPHKAIAEVVKNIKGSSSHHLNQTFNHKPKFAWQEGYGVFSLGSKQLETAINYVENQKEHHYKNTTIASLETTHE